MTNNEFIEKLRNYLDGKKCRSVWDKAVNLYASEFVDDLEENLNGGYITLEDLEGPAMLEKTLLNGADNWNEYSWSGCSLCYDYYIAKRVCTPSELKRKREGVLPPNSREDWLDVQARALYQAFIRIKKAVRLNLWEAKQ